MQATAIQGAATTPTAGEPLKLRKRIGSTTYLVSVRFSSTSNETLQDKLLRVAEGEVIRIA